jgi:hypothetical protein
MTFALFLILVIAVLSMMMVGGIPLVNDGTTETGVIPVSTNPEDEKDNLQLYTFPGLTQTPTPTPLAPPQPREEGGELYGEPPRGNSSPNSGGGRNSGSAI